MSRRPWFSIECIGRRHRRLVRLAVGLLLAGWLSALAAGALPGRAASAPAAASPGLGSLWKVGTDPTFPPFEFRDNATGTIRGFDVDLIEAIGQQAGHPIELVALPFDGIIPALQARSINAAISAITITAERARAIEFSRPYFEAGQAIVVRDNGPQPSSREQLKGLRIAVQIGTTGAIAAAEVPGARVINFDSTPLALQELANGNADAVVSDVPAILYATRQARLTGLRIVGERLSTEHYGIALPAGSPMEATINRALGDLIESGRYARIYRQWLGAEPPLLPLTAPALQRSSAPKAGLELAQLAQHLLKGAGITLLLTLLSFSFGLIGGTGLAMLLQAPWPMAHRLCRVYIDFFRGTPMLVQLFLIYFGLPALIQSLSIAFTIERLPAAVIALSLNVAAYLAEVLRSGIESIDRGQWEAADALGFSPIERMGFVIAPQAIRRVLPPLANEFITLIKDTSLAAVIGFDELFRQGQLMVATTYRAFEIYIAVALVYLVMTTSASLLFKWLERKLSLPA
ncbi:ABC transporter permease subunit [Cyanobium sp. Morenito 9A2]|uniref:ABC transporter permease subunit n=1 Tax=Cyanobium sp. Morenito 9A2 TaxID=2823718 RepID=UPI0020CD5448|nr:ABC transporter permease subunit [Cyanobium sp. Morenito 9A2]MCP9850025.1 ABC transporter permease subunit [Cyanobium sp. Morenito 9A2]